MSQLTDLLPVPEAGTPDWETIFAVKIKENQEKLVPLSLAENKILVRPAYYSAGIERALPECYARDEIRKRLLEAASMLPDGLRLVVLDSWRSKDTQTALFEACSAALKIAHPDKNEHEIKEMTEEFVAPPSLDSDCPSPHSTGGAVDLTIASTDGVPLSMGAPFDYPGPVSNTRYYEELLENGRELSGQEHEALMNRRLLYDVMTRADFVNYHGEWWHFEYGTQRWAYLQNRAHAIYGPRIVTLNTFESLLPASSDQSITFLVSAGG